MKNDFNKFSGFESFIHKHLEKKFSKLANKKFHQIINRFDFEIFINATFNSLIVKCQQIIHICEFLRFNNF